MATVNQIRKMLASGDLTEEDLRNLTLRISDEPVNALKKMVAPAIPDALAKAVPGAGFQDLAYGQGVIQSTNEDGTVNPVIRINSQPKPSGPIPLYGYGNGKLSQLGVDKPSEIDYTRNKISIPGLGDGYYSKDGRFAIGRNSDGTQWKALLGYDREQTQADQDRAYKIKEIEARLAASDANVKQSQAATEHSKVLTDNAMMYGGMPKPPADMRYNAAGELEPIPGSKLGMKQKDQQMKDRAHLDVTDRSMSALVDNIDQLIGPQEGQEHPGYQGSVGYLDSKLPPFSTNQANAQALIRGLKSKTSIEGLQTLRSSGTAPGSITEKEWPIFENYLATIDPSQGEGQYREQLVKLRQGAMQVRDAAKRNFMERYGALPQQQEQPPLVPQGGNSVTLPDGRVKTFPTPAAADAFRKATGL